MSNGRILPPKWTTASLGECVAVLDYQRVPVNAEERDARLSAAATRVPYYGATGQVGWIDRHIFDEDLVLLGEDGAPFLEHGKPKAYVIRGKSWVNNHAHVLQPIAGLVLHEILKHYLDIFDYRDYVTGTTRLKLNQARMNAMPLQLPPMAEQRRIAEKLEALLSDLEAAVKTLEGALKKLKRYRRAVLKAAVEGELSREWREAHRDQIEPASELLKRILVERRRRWEESELAKMQARGVSPDGDAWKKRYKDPKAPYFAQVPQLPQGWTWVSLAQLGVVMGGLTKNPKRDRASTKLAYLRVANVYAGELRLDDMQVIGVESEELERSLVRKWDLLVVEGNGSPEQIGRVAVWDGSIEPCVHQNHIIKVRFPFPDLSGWSALFLLSPTGRELIRMVASSTSGLYTLSISKVGDLPVALPPSEEQRLIETETRRVTSIADGLASILHANLRRAVRLRQSILEKAFRGELVPQDPNDEPAPVLLEHIRAERAGRAAEAKSSQRRRFKKIGSQASAAIE